MKVKLIRFLVVLLITTMSFSVVAWTTKDISASNVDFSQIYPPAVPLVEDEWVNEVAMDTTIKQYKYHTDSDKGEYFADGTGIIDKKEFCNTYSGSALVLTSITNLPTVNGDGGITMKIVSKILKKIKKTQEKKAFEWMYLDEQAKDLLYQQYMKEYWQHYYWLEDNLSVLEVKDINPNCYGIGLYNLISIDNRLVKYETSKNTDLISLKPDTKNNLTPTFIDDIDSSNIREVSYGLPFSDDFFDASSDTTCTILRDLPENKKVLTLPIYSTPPENANYFFTEGTSHNGTLNTYMYFRRYDQHSNPWSVYQLTYYWGKDTNGKPEVKMQGKTIIRTLYDNFELIPIYDTPVKEFTKSSDPSYFKNPNYYSATTGYRYTTPNHCWKIKIHNSGPFYKKITYNYPKDMNIETKTGGCWWVTPNGGQDLSQIAYIGSGELVEHIIPPHTSIDIIVNFTDMPIGWTGEINNWFKMNFTDCDEEGNTNNESNKGFIKFAYKFNTLSREEGYYDKAYLSYGEHENVEKINTVGSPSWDDQTLQRSDGVALAEDTQWTLSKYFNVTIK